MRLSNCESCLVYGSDKRPLSRARVEEVEEDFLHLFFKTSKLRNARLKTLVDFYDARQGCVRCLCEIELKKNPRYYETGEPWMGECEILKIYESVQRQKDLRVKVHITEEFVTDDGRFITATIQNISAGGLFLVTTQKMIRGQHFAFTYCFKTETHRVTAQVLRVQEIYGGYGYGCKFVDNPPDVEADIRNFVYVNQRKRRMERQKKEEIWEEPLS
ncbi:MAG: PilZ domain-containing protein [Lachnospiraceae bacterium]|nr:PilZ domain-containing protein [Lachnospiraceae bacterium]